MTKERREYLVKYKKEHQDVIDTQQKRYRYYNKEKRYKDSRGASIRLSVAKHRAKKRKILFDLSLDQYTNLIKEACYYCETITFGIEVGVGLDRINPKDGYTLSNVLPCCGDCNTHRYNSWTVEEMKAAIFAVNAVRKSKISVEAY